MSLFCSAYSGQLINCLLLVLSQDLLSWGLNCYLQSYITSITKPIRPLETFCTLLMFVFYLHFQYTCFTSEVCLISLHSFSKYVFQRVKICCSISDFEKNLVGEKNYFSVRRIQLDKIIIILFFLNLWKIFSFLRCVLCCVIKQSSARASLCTAAPRPGSDLWLPKNWLWQIWVITGRVRGLERLSGMSEMWKDWFVGGGKKKKAL